jgi:serine phosphatase RsbU (regulator of sigma subunit)
MRRIRSRVRGVKSPFVPSPTTTTRRSLPAAASRANSSGAGGPAVEVASRYLPADIHHGAGGDWFDVIPLSGARVALVVGDVVGHGINAAATMGRLRTAVHTLANLDLPPDELLAQLDDLVIRLTEQDGDTQGPATAVLGATCLYAIYDPVTRQCTMARAGHPPPAIIDPHGHITFPDLPAETPSASDFPRSNPWIWTCPRRASSPSTPTA